MGSVGDTMEDTPMAAVEEAVVLVHGLNCPMACGIFPDQGLNLCPLHWQAIS